VDLGAGRGDDLEVPGLRLGPRHRERI
jgi:hypothetical protein